MAGGNEGRADISFQESGARFEIFGPLADDGWWVNVTDEDGGLHGLVEHGFEAVCRAVDRWLERHVAPGDPRRFRGIEVVRWDHEDGLVRTARWATRGASGERSLSPMLSWFDDGSMPAADQVVDLAECAGDLVPEVRDGSGALLLDRREEARARLSAQAAARAGLGWPEGAPPGRRPSAARGRARPRSSLRAPSGARSDRARRGGRGPSPARARTPSPARW